MHHYIIGDDSRKNDIVFIETPTMEAIRPATGLAYSMLETHGGIRRVEREKKMAAALLLNHVATAHHTPHRNHHRSSKTSSSSGSQFSSVRIITFDSYEAVPDDIWSEIRPNLENGAGTCWIPAARFVRSGIPMSSKWVCVLWYTSHHTMSFLMRSDVAGLRRHVSSTGMTTTSIGYKNSGETESPPSSCNLTSSSSSSSSSSRSAAASGYYSPEEPTPVTLGGGETPPRGEQSIKAAMRTVAARVERLVRICLERASRPPQLDGNQSLQILSTSGHATVDVVYNTATNARYVRKMAFNETEMFYLANEIEMLMALTPHPSIMRLVTFEVIDERTGTLITEEVGTTTLRDAIRSNVTFDSVGVLRSLAAGLAHCHTHGIIHLDVKSANVVLRPGGSEAVLIDFGLASTPDASLKLRAVHGFADGGTPGYTSPQLCAGLSGSRSDDIWAFGIVAAEAFGRVLNPLSDRLAIDHAGFQMAERSRLGELLMIFFATGTPTAAAEESDAAAAAGGGNGSGGRWPQWAVTDVVMPRFDPSVSGIIDYFLAEGASYSSEQHDLIASCLALEPNARVTTANDILKCRAFASRCLF